MKRGIMLYLGLFLLVTGCGRIKRGITSPTPLLPTTEFESMVDEEPAIAADLPTAVGTSEPAPDLFSMNFVEKNTLYLRLLDEKQQAGLDTSSAEGAYLRSLEASLAGKDEAADANLHEAILLLWNT